MKKRAISFVLALIICVGLVVPSNVAAVSDDISILFDGVQITECPITLVVLPSPVEHVGHVLVSARTFTALGFLEPELDVSTMTITLTFFEGPGEGIIINVQAGSPNLVVTQQGQVRNLQMMSSAHNIGGVIMIPIQDVLEAIGWFVVWDWTVRVLHVSRSPIDIHVPPEPTPSSLGMAALGTVPIIPSITIRPFYESDLTITFTNVFDIFSVHYDSWQEAYIPAFYLDINGTISFNRESIVSLSIPTVLNVGERLERVYHRDYNIHGELVDFVFHELYTPGAGLRAGNFTPLAAAGEPIGTDIHCVFWGWDSDWRDLSIIEYFPIFMPGERGISVADIRTPAQRSLLQERYARIDTHGSSDEGRRLSYSEHFGFWEIVERRESVLQPAQQHIPITAEVAQPITAPVTSGFTLTLWHVPTDMAGHINKDVFVSAPSGRTLGGMFLVLQVTEPGSRSRPNIMQIELWDLQFAEVPIGILHQNSIVDILLVEGRSFFDPNMIIHASVDNR